MTACQVLLGPVQVDFLLVLLVMGFLGAFLPYGILQTAFTRDNPLAPLLMACVAIPVYVTLLIVTRRRGKAGSRREYVVSPLTADAMARSIAELNVTVLLCAALSEPLRRSLQAHGVRVRRHLCGDAETVLSAFLTGHLRQSDFRMPGCWGWHLDGACRRRAPRTRRAPTSKARAKAKGRSA